jgi:hypothetical protein
MGKIHKLRKKLAPKRLFGFAKRTESPDSVALDGGRHSEALAPRWSNLLLAEAPDTGENTRHLAALASSKPRPVTVHQSQFPDPVPAKSVTFDESAIGSDQSTSYTTSLQPSQMMPGMLSPPSPSFKSLPFAHAMTFDSSSFRDTRFTQSLKKLIPAQLSMTGNKSKTMDPIVSPTSFQQLPLQRFGTIEANHGANLSYRMNKKQEEQEHYTIHAFDRQGKTIVDKLVGLRPITSGSVTMPTKNVDQTRSILNVWPTPATTMNDDDGEKQRKRKSFSLRKK